MSSSRHAFADARDILPYGGLNQRHVHPSRARSSQSHASHRPGSRSVPRGHAAGGRSRATDLVASAQNLLGNPGSRATSTSQHKERRPRRRQIQRIEHGRRRVLVGAVVERHDKVSDRVRHARRLASAATDGRDEDASRRGARVHPSAPSRSSRCAYVEGCDHGLGERLRICNGRTVAELRGASPSFHLAAQDSRAAAPPSLLAPTATSATRQPPLEPIAHQRRSERLRISMSADRERAVGRVTVVRITGAARPSRGTRGSARPPRGCRARAGRIVRRCGSCARTGCSRANSAMTPCSASVSGSAGATMSPER